ncbi:iron ABC transporter permease [Paenibacillus sp. L3-i20]|uniref:FecCD family ABC transporter permease n=1 Tax=Paenibacillus sp. L3-i20 TaxID=2905833 RepID=UPI001EDCEE75|nr:iron ABC transporter permease [Paenibacillus sp. L3-i20]GKU76211.1 siderophore ABC transporter permease [Paenibacillus sp. L3-i20]
MKARLMGLIVLFILVAVALVSSISFGIVQVPFTSALNAIWSFDGTYDQLIIRTVRVPRALIAAAVGGALAVAGCLMQALSRNALAGPEIFGVNSGAALAVVIVSIVMNSTALSVFTWSAIVGAGIAGASVFLLGSIGRESLTPIKLVLAGATINLLLTSITQGILILNEQSLDTMRFWLAGSVTGRDIQLFIAVFPYILFGLICAFCLSKHLNIIVLGEHMAQGLGERVFLIKVLCIIVIVILAGSSVAIAGPIGFIGLAIPHIARSLVGLNYRWIIPYAALLGALLLLLADIGSRFVLPAQEIPVGVVTAFFGAPFLIYLAQRRGRSL